MTEEMDEKEEREQLLRGGMSLSGPRAATSCYMVGVFDRRSGELQLHYAGDRVHALEQSVKRLANAKAKANAFEGLSYRDQREELLWAPLLLHADANGAEELVRQLRARGPRQR